MNSFCSKYARQYGFSLQLRISQNRILPPVNFSKLPLAHNCTQTYGRKTFLVGRTHAAALTTENRSTQRIDVAGVFVVVVVVIVTSIYPEEPNRVDRIILCTGSASPIPSAAPRRQANRNALGACTGHLFISLTRKTYILISVHNNSHSDHAIM